jgi:hypothetical protein
MYSTIHNTVSKIYKFLPCNLVKSTVFWMSLHQRASTLPSTRDASLVRQRPVTFPLRPLQNIFVRKVPRRILFWKTYPIGYVHVDAYKTKIMGSQSKSHIATDGRSVSQ